MANPISALDSGTTDGLARDASGFFYGASIGRGSMGINCDECRNRPSLTDGLSVTAHAGFRLMPRLGIYGEYWLNRWRDRDGTWFNDADVHSIRNELLTVGAQLWVTRRLYLKASLGYGRHTTDAVYEDKRPILFSDTSGQAVEPEVFEPEGKTSSNALATSAGIGFEFIRTKTFGMSLEFRFAKSQADSRGREINSAAASFGLAWF